MEKRIDREIEQKEGLLEDLEKTDDLRLTQLIHHKSTLVDIRELSLGYKGAEGFVTENLTMQINKGDRIALHGENGCGITARRNRTSIDVPTSRRPKGRRDFHFCRSQ